MTRSRPLAALGALGLALAAAGCGSSKTSPPGVRLRQPAAVAPFVGRTLQDPTNLRPYLVVANATRNDLSVLDAVQDTVVPAPIKLRGLLLPVENRPSLLVSASLGDGKSDLLLAVSGGDSVLQLVETWNATNAVHGSPAADTPPLAADLGHDVVALAVVPSAPGTARIAAALSGARVAVVEYARAADGEAIVLVSQNVSPAPLPFQPDAIAALPDDPGVAGVQTAIYVATRDEVAPGVHGVAEISTDLSTVRGLGARGPTRLVAAARVRERLAGSAASDDTAFASQPLVPRVYAVLDESGCGSTKPIDCGVVTLDPDPALASGAQAIPPDYAGLMPYRAPMRVPGRPLALAVSGPPAKPPPDVAGEPAGGSQGWQALGTGFMRLYMTAKIARATTGVAAVASDNGSLYYLDLGRFEAATAEPLVTRTRGASDAKATFVSTQQGTPPVSVDRRLWIQAPGTTTFADPDASAKQYVTVTPGFTPDDTWVVAWQGVVSADLDTRAAEAGELAPGQPWLALQQGAAGTAPSQVVRLWDPAVGVKPGDIVVIKAAAVPVPPAPAAACVGTDPLGTKTGTPASQIQKEFEVEVASLVAPADAYPGGAVSLVQRTSENQPEWSTCYEALVAAVAGGKLATGLTATFRASGVVLVGATAGYAGRPVLGQPFTLGYPNAVPPNAPAPSPPAPNEDALAAACPVADWNGALPAPACDDACRAACETLVLARKSRRLHNVSSDCSTDATDTAACQATWPPAQYPFPVVNGPALAFQVNVEDRSKAVAAPARELRQGPLTLSTVSQVKPLLSRGTSTSPYGASGAASFDRSAWADDPVAGYRFLVSYPSDFVLDATPSQSAAPAIVIR